ncbi:MAG: tRNA-dihydrouridine synthase family protein [Candidatus Heimdallarchaeota archaeon]|nr:tRNA-dihydrouridine synthase family protein [Candidatus Heimdallarchaeota archaeon]
MIRIVILGLNKKPYILSPLASITIPPFRGLCAELGADVTVSEMTFARSILCQNPRSLKRIQKHPSEKLFGIQLLTNSSEDLKGAIERIERNKLSDFIELNLGCPKARIINSNLGSSLLKNKNKKILINLLQIGGSTCSIPFALKIRAGYSKKVYKSVLRLAEKYNIAFITFHARLGVDTYKIPANPKFWAETKNISSIPIIANGDVYHRHQAEEILGKLNLDGVAIGRGARGNPQIFSSTPQLDTLEIYERFIEYLQTSDYFTLFNLKLHSADILKNYRFSAQARKKLMNLNDMEEIIKYTKNQLISKSYSEE